MTRSELICHSDADSQHTTIRFTEHHTPEDITPSISTVGDAYNNTLIESVIGPYKTEYAHTTISHDGPYKTTSDIEYATAD